MATFEEVVAQNGARFQTPTFRENGRYAYGTLNGTNYTYFTPRNAQYESAEMRTNAAFCCNCIALDMNLPELRGKKSCFLTSLTRVCTIPPAYASESSTRVVNENKIAIPVKPLLLRIKNDKKYSSQCSAINVIPCKSTDVDYYFAKNVEFEVIKYIDVRKHSTTNTTINRALNGINEEVLSVTKFGMIGALLPDTDSSGETYDDLIVVYDNFSIKFDYIIFTKEHGNARSEMHIISAYNMTTIDGAATKFYKGTLDTFEYEAYGPILEQTDELLYGNLPGAIITHVDTTSEGAQVDDPTTGAMQYSEVKCSVSRTNYSEYTRFHKFWPGGEVVDTDSIDTAVNSAIRTIKRSNKGKVFNCAISMQLDIGYSDKYDRMVVTDYITSTIHIDLVHSDIISTGYYSKTASGALDIDYSLFLARAVYLTDAESFIDVTSKVLITTINEYRFDPAILIDVIYKLYNGDHTHFQFNKSTRSSGQIKATVHDYTGDEIEDTFKFIESNPSLQYTENTPFITPMEYYAKSKTNFDFDDKVENILSTEDEPNYFWIETLKNWGYFTINGQLSQDSNIVVDLLLWNGLGQWIDAAAILDNIKKNFIPKHLYQHYIDRIKYLAPHTPPYGNQEYDKLNTMLNNMIAMLFARNSTIPFKFENVTTVDIERSFHNSVANYAGKSSKSWWEYIPVVYVIKGGWSGLKAVWNFSPAGMFYNAVWGDGVWEGIKTGYKDLFDCVYNWYGGSVVDLIELGIDLLFTDNTDAFVSKLDPYQHLMSIARYIVLSYDEKYSNNDANTLQTIRPDLVRYTNLEGGIINRESIIEYSVIPNVIGSPFVARSSTGELMLAYRMCYSGPVKEDASSEHDLIKMSGIIEKDVEFSNKLLQDKLGKGLDKTALDMFNTFGKLPSTDLKSSATTKLPETTETAGVDRLSNQVQTTFGAITLKTNRSKTSSDLDSAEINTLTKW